MTEPRHPIQPLIAEQNGRLRFKENKIVRYLLDNGGIDLNKIACLNFSQEDSEQFAQLIGYSLDGFYELSYTRTETGEAAKHAYYEGVTADQARANAAEALLAELRAAARKATNELLNVLPEDFS